MFWESSVFSDFKHFDSVKLYIFFKHFSDNFFNLSLSNFLIHLKFNHPFYFKYIAENTSLQSSFTFNLDTNLQPLKIYIYSVKAKFYVLYIYTNINKLKQKKNFSNDGLDTKFFTKNILYL